ncbi:MAG: tetratricopeptide repeat protein [Planctomycetota bacterium]
MITETASPSPWVESCRELLDRGRIPVAREQIEQRLFEDPADVEALVLQGVLLAVTGQPGPAETTLRRVLDRSRQDPLRLERLGHVFADLEREDLVAEVARELRDLCPRSSISAYFEGRASEITGNLEAARTCWKRALEKDPTGSLPRRALARALEQAGRYQEALEHAERLAEQSPSEGDVLALRGRLLLQVGRFEEAELELTAAQRAGTTDLEAPIARAIRLGGDPQRALDVLSMPRLAPTPEVAVERVFCLDGLGRREEAAAMASASLLQMPDHPELQWLAHRLAREDSLDDAPPAVLGGFMGRVRFPSRSKRPRVACLPFSSLGQDAVNVAFARGIASVITRSLAEHCDSRFVPFYKDRAGKEAFAFDFSPGYSDLIKWGKATGARWLIAGESYLLEEAALRLRVYDLETGEEQRCPEVRFPRQQLVPAIDTVLRHLGQALECLETLEGAELHLPFPASVSTESLLHYFLAAPPPIHSVARCRSLLAAVLAGEGFEWAEQELRSEIQALEGTEDADRALDVLAAFASARPSDVALQRQLAERALQKGNPALALTAFERWRAADPGAELPAFTLAQILHAEGRLDEAIEAYREATSQSDRAAEACGELAGLLARRDRSDEAIAQWRKALELDPGLTRYRIRLTEALLDRGKLEEAEAEITLLESLDPPPQGVGSLRRRIRGARG